MHILIISQWFDPEPTFKGYLFAKELQRLGHDVSVVTGFPNYPGGTVYSGYKIKIFQREDFQGIKVLRVPLYPSHDGSGSRRVLNYLSFALAASVGVLVGRRPDVAYVYHPPATVALPAVLLKAVKGVPYVYDVQDLWPDTLAATGMITNRTVLNAVGHVLVSIYKRAGRVVVLSQGFKDALTARGVPGGKVDVIPNWADEGRINVNSGDLSELKAQLGFDQRFTVTFAGNLGKAQGLDTVLDAAETLVAEKDVRFLLVGGGLEADRLAEDARRRNLDNIVFMERRPIEEIGEILQLSDAVLVHLRDDPLFEITVPSKTQAYLMAGRPVLMGVRGEAARLIEEAGAGFIFPPEDPQGLADAVLKLKLMSEAERAALGEAGRAYYSDTLSLAVGAARFAEVLGEASLTHAHTAAAKRVIDVVGSASALAILGLPMAAVAALVRRKLGSPVLFRQIRPGLHGEPFAMLKFRSMTDERDEQDRLLPDSVRLTPFGRFLRSSSLDELPGLWNVLKGNMSLVGPRPLLTRYTPFFRDEERLRLRVRPGITGWAQIHGRNTVSWDARLGLDVWYVKNHSVLLDIKIIGATLQKVFSRQGVVVDPVSTMQDLDEERQEATV